MWFASFRSFCCFSHYMLMSGSMGPLNLISTHTYARTHTNSLNWHTHTHTHLLALTCWSWSWSGWRCVIGQTASFACLLRLRWPFDIINCNTEQLRYDFRPLSPPDHASPAAPDWSWARTIGIYILIKAPRATNYILRVKCDALRRVCVWATERVLSVSLLVCVSM